MLATLAASRPASEAISLPGAPAAPDGRPRHRARDGRSSRIDPTPIPDDWAGLTVLVDVIDGGGRLHRIEGGTAGFAAEGPAGRGPADDRDRRPDSGDRRAGPPRGHRTAGRDARAPVRDRDRDGRRGRDERRRDRRGLDRPRLQARPDLGVDAQSIPSIGITGASPGDAIQTVTVDGSRAGRRGRRDGRRATGRLPALGAAGRRRHPAGRRVGGLPRCDRGGRRGGPRGARSPASA